MLAAAATTAASKTVSAGLDVLRLIYGYRQLFFSCGGNSETKFSQIIFTTTLLRRT